MPPLSPSLYPLTTEHSTSLLIRDAATATASGSTSTTDAGLTASDLIEEAEEHWNVSASSILAAWGSAIVLSFLILLAFSFARVRWKLIYLPRIKVRKRGRVDEVVDEKEEERKKFMTKEEKKRYKAEKERLKPDCYPPEDPPPGIWISKAPKADMSLLGWLKPAYRETMVELRAGFPRWCCPCLGDTGQADGAGGKDTSGKVGEPRGETLFEQDRRMLSWLGLDAMVYLLFLRLLKYLFSTIAFLAAILAMANYFINVHTSDGSTSAFSPTEDSDATTTTTATTTTSSGNSSSSIIENPQLLTAANITGNGLIVHISFEWIVTALVVFFVLKSSAYHMKLVQIWTQLNRNEVSFKTIMITNLAIQRDRKRNLITVADARNKIRSTILGPNHKNGPDSTVWFAMDDMKSLHERMEAFKNKHLKPAVKAVAMETAFGPGHGVFYDSCTGSLCGSSKSAEKRVETAVEEKRKIEHTQAEIREGQFAGGSTPLKGTVTSAFLTVPTAKKVREILQSQRVKLKQAGHPIQRAPRSHNVLWRNLELDVKARRWHGTVGKGLLILICFLNTIPVMIITILANLGTSIDRWPTLAKLEESSDIWRAVFTVLAGVLPASISALFSYMLPYIMRRLSRWSGALTRGELDKAVIRQLFVFLLVSNFVVFSLLGVVYETYLTISEDIGKESWSTIYESLGDLPAKVTRAYISESLYWLSWYPIRSLVLCLEMLQVPRMLMKIPQLLSFKTPHDLAEVHQPENFHYAIEYSHILFAMVVGIVYAPLAPIVVICAAVFFWSAHIVHTNQLKYVEDSKETDGKCWKIIINRLLVSTVFMHVLMALTVGLKTRSIPLVIAAALPIGIIFLFKLYLRRHYHPDDYIDPCLGDDDDNEDADADALEAPRYEHELLKHDWMPKIKTVNNSSSMSEARRKFHKLEELLRIGHKSEKEKGRKESRNRSRSGSRKGSRSRKRS